MATEPSITASSKNLKAEHPATGKPLHIKKFWFVRYADPHSLKATQGEQIRVHNHFDKPVRLLFVSGSAFAGPPHHEIGAEASEVFTMRSGAAAVRRYEYEIDVHPFRDAKVPWLLLLCRKITMFVFALVARKKGGSNPEMIIE